MKKAINQNGFSMIEMMVSLGVLAIVLASVYSAYVTQIKQSTQQYKGAQAELELGIAKNIIERDLDMAGYGLADDYTPPTGIALPFAPPRAVRATNGAPDSLTLRGTALGIETRGNQRWSFISAVNQSPITLAFASWGDSREDLAVNDAIFLMEPSAKKFLMDPNTGNWLYSFKGSGANLNPGLASPWADAWTGNLVYAAAAGATRPYATVLYSLGNGGAPATCAPGALSLMRAESWTADPAAGAGNSILTCVLDLQVAFGLDTTLPDPDGNIDVWDNGGVAAEAYDPVSLKRRVRQIRFYVLVQTENQDTRYTYPANTIRVGEASLGTGQDVPLTAAQKNYHWKVLTFAVTPRNMR